MSTDRSGVGKARTICKFEGNSLIAQGVTVGAGIQLPSACSHDLLT